MKILVTGSSGLVGRNVVELLKFSTHELLAPSHAELDLLNRDDVYKYLKKNQPDCVIHLAAKVGSIAANARYPLQFLLENLDMGRNIIVGAFETGVKKFVNIGSACVYPAEKYNQLLSEDMAVTGENEGYSISKATGVLMCKYIFEMDSTRLYKTLIPCNIYGRWSSFKAGKTHMIAAAIQKIYRAREENLPEVEIWGDGEAKREFIYAGDLAEIILYAVENLEKFPPLINIGSGEEHTVNECYETIAEILEYKGKFVHDLTKPSGTNRRLLDVGLMRKMGLIPKTSLEDGIRQTINFYETCILNKSKGND